MNDFQKLTDGEIVILLPSLILIVLLLGGLIVWINDRFSNSYDN